MLVGASVVEKTDRWRTLRQWRDGRRRAVHSSKSLFHRRLVSAVARRPSTTGSHPWHRYGRRIFSPFGPCLPITAGCLIVNSWLVAELATPPRDRPALSGAQKKKRKRVRFRASPRLQTGTRPLSQPRCKAHSIAGQMMSSKQANKQASPQCP